MSLRIGIDVGGSKIEIIALDIHSNQVLQQYRVRAPQNDYLQTIECIRVLVSDVEQKLGCSGTVGVGIPGSIGHQKTVKNSNSVWTNGQPMLEDLSLVLQREVRLANDANCFAVSESIDGAAQGLHCVFGVIIGTGCGGGIAIDGVALEGRNGLTGEWGHNPLPFPLVYGVDHSLLEHFDRIGRVERSSIYQHKQRLNYEAINSDDTEYPGPQCYCGKRGCLETWLSGPGFENDYQRTAGVSLPSNDIVALAKSGDHLAVRVFDRYCERLAKSLAQIINTVDPDAIVLGGGMSNIDLGAVLD